MSGKITDAVVEVAVHAWLKAEYYAIRSAVEAVYPLIMEEAVTIVLEQRCERNTPWDSALLAAATAIRKAGGVK